MPLRSPILDDRSYQQLRDELVRRIPVYAPEWTDHGPGDPGVTLIELFAHLGESLLYRFNQIPETAHLALLRLLDVPLRPATPARVLVALRGDAARGALVPIGAELRAGKQAFELESEVVVWPLEVRAMARIAAAPPAPGSAQDLDAGIRDAIGGLADGEVAAYYEAHTLTEDPAAPGARPLELARSVDRMLWIAVIGRDASVRDRLGGAVINLAIAPDPDVARAGEAIACAELAAQGAPLVWQASTPAAVDPARGQRPVYRELVPIGDTTRGLRQPGVVRLQLPADAHALGDFALVDPEVAGTGDLPPVIDDDRVARRVLFWLRAFRPDGSELERLAWVGVNGGEALQVRTARSELLGLGSGQPDQRRRLAHAHVVAGTLTVDVEEADGWIEWTEVDGFHASGDRDRHFVVDLEAGEVRFGDGLRGTVPQIGQRIRARSYRYGGGRDGNVPAGAIDQVVGLAGVTARNPLPARGGADAEALEDALARIPAELRRRDRAVASDDFRALALATPGADVGRAEVLPLHHPRTPAVDAQGRPAAAGVVSVVVWPRDDHRRPGAPMPDRATMAAVCRWLDGRRLVTTELYVIPPTYRPIAVAIGIAVQPGHGVEAVRRWVERVLRQYLAPLPPFGPAGQGWPLGRRVIGAELEATAVQVEGVELIQGLHLAARDGDRWVPADTIALAPHEVVELAALTVTIGAPLAAGADIAPRALAATPMPIPVVQEEC